MLIWYAMGYSILESLHCWKWVWSHTSTAGSHYSLLLYSFPSLFMLALDSTLPYPCFFLRQAVSAPFLFLRQRGSGFCHFIEIENICICSIFNVQFQIREKEIIMNLSLKKNHNPVYLGEKVIFNLRSWIVSVIFHVKWKKKFLLICMSELFLTVQIFF